MVLQFLLCTSSVAKATPEPPPPPPLKLPKLWYENNALSLLNNISSVLKKFKFFFGGGDFLCCLSQSVTLNNKLLSLCVRNFTLRKRILGKIFLVSYCHWAFFDVNSNVPTVGGPTLKMVTTLLLAHSSFCPSTPLLCTAIYVDTACKVLKLIFFREIS